MKALRDKRVEKFKESRLVQKSRCVLSSVNIIDDVSARRFDRIKKRKKKMKTDSHSLIICHFFFSFIPFARAKIRFTKAV